MKSSSYPIFLVEDNEIYLRTLEKRLTANLKINPRIHTFSNGEDCLSNMSLKPKIIILDYFLNSSITNAMNGLDTLKQIKKIDPEVAVVMLSSQNNIKVATDTMKHGAFDYVSKNENDFLRVQNAIYNIHKMITQAAELKMSRKVKWILSAWIAVLLGVIVILQLYYPELMSRNN